MNATKTMLALLLLAGASVGQVAATSTRSLVEYECHDCHDPCHDCHDDCHDCHDPCHDCHDDCHDCHHDPEPDYIEFAEAISINEGYSKSVASADGTYTSTNGISDAMAIHFGLFGEAVAHASQDNSAQANTFGAESGSDTFLVANAQDGLWDEECGCYLEEVSYAEVEGVVTSYALSNGGQNAVADAGGVADAKGFNVPFTADIFEGSSAFYAGGSYSEAIPFAGAFTGSGFEEDTNAVYLGFGEGFAEGVALGEAGGYACLGFGCTLADPFPAEEVVVVVDVVEP
jgi:hypothetical protein